MRQKRMPSLFPNYTEFKKALETCVSILQEGVLQTDNEGFSVIEDLCVEAKKRDNSLNYLTNNHIIELYIRDPKKRILISGSNKVKFKNVKYVQPPDILYFGTLSHLVEKMKKNGLRSSTKGYLKLFSNPQSALEFAEKFKKGNEEPVYLTIKAKEAFERGVRFSTFKEGVYIVSKLDKKYIV